MFYSVVREEEVLNLEGNKGLATSCFHTYCAPRVCPEQASSVQNLPQTQQNPQQT
jgi:hypothetical protein